MTTACPRIDSLSLRKCGLVWDCERSAIIQLGTGLFEPMCLFPSTLGVALVPRLLDHFAFRPNTGTLIDTGIVLISLVRYIDTER